MNNSRKTQKEPMDRPISPVNRSKEQAKANYNHLSTWYDWFASSEKPYIAAGLSELDLSTNANILEVGCGTGYALTSLLERIGGAGKVYGIDLSNGMLEVTRKKIAKKGYSTNSLLLQSDASFLPFHNGSFNNLFISFTLELFNTKEIPLVLSECRRVLKPDGQICVVSMVRDVKASLPIQIYEWFHSAFPVMVDCRPIFLHETLLEAGFSIDKTRRGNMWGLPVETCTAHPQ